MTKPWTTSDRASVSVFSICNYTLFGLLSLAFLIPFLVVFAISVVGEQELLGRSGFILFPRKFDFGAYQLLLSQGSIVVHAYSITLFRVAVGTVLNLVFTATFAYTLARRGLPGRNVLVTLVFITMIISGGLIPNYFLMKALGLLDSVWVLIIPALISPWYLFIMRNFFMAIPMEIEESAFIDGASPAAVLWRIIVPLSMPSFATIGLFYAVGHWNEWFSAVIYINDAYKQPVQVIMRSLLISGSPQDQLQQVAEVKPPPMSLRSAAIIIGTLPILAVYPFIQRYFVKGIMIGSIKG